MREENIAISLARLTDISALLSETETKLLCKGRSLDRYNFVWIQSAGLTKDIAFLVSQYLDELNIPHTHPETEITKIVDLFTLSLNKLPIPKTYFCAQRKLLLQLPYIAEELGYPFMVKTTVGWGGDDVHIIHNAADFFRIVPDLTEHKKYTCQTYIPNTFDYRIIVGNGIVLSGEKRVRTNDLYRNNVKCGADEIFLKIEDIPQEVRDIAIKVSAVCKLSWAGIDIVTNSETGKHYVLEVNRRPGITGKSSETVAAMTFLKAIKQQVVGS